MPFAIRSGGDDAYAEQRRIVLRGQVEWQGGVTQGPATISPFFPVPSRQSFPFQMGPYGMRAIRAIKRDVTDQYAELATIIDKGAQRIEWSCAV